jgi:SAM-dependent methyltransferase
MLSERDPDAPASVKLFFHPEIGAGGFSSIDGTVQFYNRVNALLQRHQTVLDLGAGRGAASHEDACVYRLALRTLKGKCECVIGVDFDESVLSNPLLDEGRVIPSCGTLPIDESSVDLVLCDAVFEHVLDVDPFVFEISRVLRPGGWLCARTPNKYGYIGIGARVIPNRWHVNVLSRVQPSRLATDVFPTAYLLNTRSAIKAAFRRETWDHYIYTWNAEPAYVGESRLGWRAMMLIFRLTPERLGSIFNVFLRKRVP